MKLNYLTKPNFNQFVTFSYTLFLTLTYETNCVKTSINSMIEPTSISWIYNIKIRTKKKKKKQEKALTEPVADGFRSDCCGVITDTILLKPFFWNVLIELEDCAKNEDTPASFWKIKKKMGKKCKMLETHNRNEMKKMKRLEIGDLGEERWRWWRDCRWSRHCWLMKWCGWCDWKRRNV